MEPWNPDFYDISGIQVLSSIAPTVFMGVAGNQPSLPHEVPYHLFAGSADGDVTGGPDCDVCQYLRIPGAAEGDLAVTYLHGASHNVFHDGGGFDDGIGPARLVRGEVHPMQQAVYLALMGWRLMGEDMLSEVFTRNADAFRPLGIADDLVLSTMWRDGVYADKLVVDDFQGNDANTNALGGAVVQDLVEFETLKLDDGNANLTANGTDVADGFTWAARDGWERGLIVAWDGDASYATAMPEGQRSVKRYDVLSLRVAQTTRHANTSALNGDLVFDVELIDADGTVASLSTDAFARPGKPYARNGLGAGTGWINEFSTIELPLDGFLTTAPDLDLRNLTQVRLRFGPSHGSAMGRVGIDDIYFSRRP